MRRAEILLGITILASTACVDRHADREAFADIPQVEPEHVIVAKLASDKSLQVSVVADLADSYSRQIPQAEILRNGKVVVLDRAGRIIRVYDAFGRATASFGAFADSQRIDEVMGLSVADDTIIVIGRRRLDMLVAYYDETGRSLGSDSIEVDPEVGGLYDVVGTPAGARLLASRTKPQSQHLYREYLLLGPDGNSVIAGWRHGVPILKVRAAYLSRPYAETFAFARGVGGTFAASLDTGYVFLYYNASGNLMTQVSVEYQPTPVTDSDWAELADSIAGSFSDRAMQVEARETLDSISRPRNKPPIGGLWLSDSIVTIFRTDLSKRRYDRIGLDGRGLGSFALPGDKKLIAANDGLLVAAFQMEEAKADSETFRVTLYRLQ